jgi:hypothetical protein
VLNNVTIDPGVPLTVTNSATDSNIPPLPLTYSLLTAPAGATIDSSSGVVNWRPAATQAATTNLFTVQVQNGASPALSATRSFFVQVNQLVVPTAISPVLTNGVFGFQINGGLGPDYLIETSTNLVDWLTVQTNTPTSLPFYWTAPLADPAPARFYRVRLSP